jgi:hypothetical protein
MNVYKVSYKTSWADSTYMEDGWLHVAAENAEKAIEKAKDINAADTYEDEETKEVVAHDTFELQAVSFVVKLDG